MDAVGLNGAGYANQILIEHGHKRRVITSRDLGKHRLEAADVFGSIIGRQRDAGHQHTNMRIDQRSDHVVKIGAGLRLRQATQSVVSAELDNHDCRVQAEDERQAGNRIFGGGSTRAFVDDLVMVAAIVENLL
jgi:hypothetical protein